MPFLSGLSKAITLLAAKPVGSLPAGLEGRHPNEH